MPPASADACVVDTHSWLFAATGAHDRLGRRARRVLERATTAYVPAIALWEVAMLAERGRIALDRPLADWLAIASSDAPFAIQALTPAIAARAVAVGAAGFPPDPADRLIYATAGELDVPLLSADGRISAFERSRRDRRVVWD